jgi:hypothetical protein
LVGLVTAPLTSASIVIGQSIAGIALGDTQQHVERILGPLSYSKTTGLFHPRRKGSLHIHFANGTVDLVGLFAAYGQQTATGIEIGSTRRQFKHAYPHAHCMPDFRETLACYITAHFRDYKTHTEFWFSKTGQLEEIGLAYTLGPDGPVRIARAIQRHATAAQPAGLTITGPQSIEAGTAYTYNVTAVTNRSYRGAALWFYSLDCSQRRVVRLVAHKAWQGSFTMSLSAPGLTIYPWVTATLVSPPTKKPPYAHVLYKAALQLTAAPTASPAPVDTSPPGSRPGCEQMGN